MTSTFQKLIDDLDGLDELVEFGDWLRKQDVLNTPLLVVEFFRSPEEYAGHFDVWQVWKASTNQWHLEMLESALSDNSPSPDRLTWGDFNVFKTESSKRMVWKWEPINGNGPHGICASPAACVDAIDAAEAALI